MERRRFIKYSLAGLTSASSASLLHGCASSVRPIVTSPVVKETVKVIIGDLVPRFIDFAVNIDLDKVSERFEDWYYKQDRSDQLALDKVGDMLRSGGFVRYDTPVYRYGEYYFYGVENKDGINICSPCFNIKTKARAPMVEGPVLLGLMAASQSSKLRRDLNKAGFTLAEILLPIVPVQEPSCSLFETSNEPFKYQTSEASLNVDYDFNNYEKESQIQLKVENEIFQFKQDISVKF